ncbi:MAG: septum formation initiator family protein [Nitrospinae bacterium]|nr:septum formation initiator family protein [Nitrospinota bacterium]MBL7021348.1 septum formation initiator family protein [Nitrospinaceae bacterium]
MTKNSRYQKIFLLSLSFFLLLVLMAVFHENGILNAYQLEQGQFEIKHENENLRSENEKLRLEITRLKSDPYEIEKIAREKLNLIKPGDQVYHIVQAQKPLPLIP